jgi:hypothetical protein
VEHKLLHKTPEELATPQTLAEGMPPSLLRVDSDPPYPLLRPDSIWAPRITPALWRDFAAAASNPASPAANTASDPPLPNTAPFGHATFDGVYTNASDAAAAPSSAAPGAARQRATITPPPRAVPDITRPHIPMDFLIGVTKDEGFITQEISTLEVGQELNKGQMLLARHMLAQHRAALAFDPGELGRTSLVWHKIDGRRLPPPQARLYSYGKAFCGSHAPGFG